MSLKTIRRALLMLSAQLGLVACDLTNAPHSADDEAQLFVHSRGVSLVPGDTASVGVTRRRAGSGSIDATRGASFNAISTIQDAEIVWTVRDTSVATIEPTGLVRAKRLGATTLIATDGQLTDSTTVTVAGADVWRAFTVLKMGTGHACAIDPDRAVWCWGGSWSGELGTGQRLRAAVFVSPQRITLPEPIVDVAVGTVHTCALGSSGAVYCSGDNLTGQIAGSSEYQVLRFQRVDVPVLTAIDASGSETCGITTVGAVYCWGGTGVRGGSLYPPPSGERFATVTAGVGHRCALTVQRALYCWGSLNGSNGVTPALPTLIATPAPIRTITAANARNCAVDTAGVSYCWFPGSRRELTAAQRIVDVPSAVLAVVRENAQCVLATDGTVWCSGVDLFGALGRGGSYTGNQSTADLTFSVAQPVLTAERFVSLSGSGSSYCALTAAGRAFCWGNNAGGVLGSGSRRRLFPSISAPFSPVPLAVR
jgi:hypothetical protein